MRDGLALSGALKAILALLVISTMFAPVILATFTTGAHTIIAEPKCEKCHQQIVEEKAASEPTYHKNIECTDCHRGDIHGYTLPENPSKDICGYCHGDIYSKWAEGGHAREGVQCWYCHSNYEYTGGS